MYIPNLGELSIFIAALWAPVSVSSGIIHTPPRYLWAIREVLAWRWHHRCPGHYRTQRTADPHLLHGFPVRTSVVVIQVSYFKYTKRKYGEGRRVFLMSPLHHHYQKLGYQESKIAVRF